MKPKQLLMLILCMLMASTASAYDFSATYNGKTIYYNKTSVTTAEVTYYSSSYNSYSGDVTIPSGVTYSGITYSVTGIGVSAFRECSSLTSVTIPKSVTSIKSGAFSNCSSLTSVTIPNSVTSIGTFAFFKCTSLTEVTIPNSVTSIDIYAFSGCSSLGSVTIPNSVTSIVSDAFSNCSSLTSVTIPNSVTSIGVHAFSDCSSLGSVTIPNSVTSIGNGAFSHCTGLKEVTIPNSVTSIGNNAFFYCRSLTSVTIPNSVTSIGTFAFCDCSSLTSVTIPNSVTSIGTFAFSGCSRLGSVTIPNSVTSIGDQVFNCCTGLTEVTIPNSVTSIGYCAFEDCSRLTSVTIPNSVTSIRDKAFCSCFNLKAVTIQNSNPEEIQLGDDVFYGIPSDCVLYVPYGCMAAYEADVRWTAFSSIKELEPEQTETYDKVYFEGQELLKGRTARIPLYMVNLDPIVSFNCDFVLPEGIELAKDANNKNIIETGERCDDTFVVASSILANGNVRAICYSSNNTPLANNEEAVLYLTVNVSDLLGIGDELPFRIVNCSMTTESLRDIQAPDTEAVFTINTVMPGDVNNDGKFNSTDVSLEVEYVLAHEPENGYIVAADVNNDGRINSTDVSTIISFILNDVTPGANHAPAFVGGVLHDECLTFGGAIAENESSQWLKVGLTNSGRYISAQFDVQMPDGISISAVRIPDSNHQAAFREIAPNKWRVIVFSADNSEFASDSFVEILVNNLYVDAQDITICNVVMSARNGNRIDEYTAEGIAIAASTTAVESLLQDRDDALRFNLNGVKATKSDRGIQIVNGHKTIITK